MTTAAKGLSQNRSSELFGLYKQLMCEINDYGGHFSSDVPIKLAPSPTLRIAKVDINGTQ